MRKILLILTALVMSVAVFAQKITTPGGITSGNKYYIGATTGSNDFYFYVDGSSTTESIKGAAKEDKADAVALTFTAVTGGWTIQFDNGYYLGLKNAKDNGAVQVVEDAVVWTIDEDVDNGLLKLHPNDDYYLQKNSGNTLFGSYKNIQTDVWLESAGGATPVSAILESIVIKGAATKMAYEVGEAFDPAGLEVWGLYTKYVKNDSTSQITSGITWSINPETFTTVSGNASVTLSASYKDKTSSDTTIMGINVSDPAPMFYLCFTAEAANSTIELEKSGSPTGVTIQYQVNGTAADGWTSVDFSTATTTGQITLANVGDKVYFRNASSEVTGFSTSGSNYYQFDMTGFIAASGNVMSLVDKSCQTLTIPCNFCFTKLFQGCASLTTAPELPATTLTDNCYQYMFSHCSTLTAAPELPATIMATRCYQYMFENCASLTAAPALPATTLATYCYSNMFNKCYTLMTAPALPATTLADYCYQYMFFDCDSLTTAPALPATTLADYCYVYMFANCDSLTTAPALPATTLANNCYQNMFANCASLATAPALPATTLTDNCYQNMFVNCASLATAPALPATTLTDKCYQNMFAACSTLVVNTTAPGVAWSIPAGATGSSNATSNMFYGTGGDFTGAPAPGTTYYIYSAIPGLEQIIADSVAGKAAGATVTIDLDTANEYPLLGIADAGLVNIVINGHGAKVTLADSTQIVGMQGLTINNVNFDCAANTKLAPIALSANPDSSLVGTNFQTEGTSLRAKAFYNTGTITLSNCNFSGVKTSLVSANKREWNLKNLTIKNCIVQFDVASGIESYINWYGNSNNEGSIKEIVIEGSTLYNIVEDNSNYFLRYANNSNSQPQKAWAEPQFDGKCSWTMTNNTFVNLPSNKHFANNYPNKNPICEFTWTGNIFYNTTMLQKAIQGNVANFTAADNAIIGITKAVDATDNQKYATIDSLLIKGDNRMTTPTTVLDFTKIDSLVNNFAPATTSYAGSHGFGDPRWLTLTGFTITANVNDTAMGSVTGAGEYAIGAEVTLTATANEGYRFSNWTNANTGDTLSTENPWTITVTQDSTIVANFVINNLFTITLNVNDEAMGSVEGAGIYTRGDVAVVTAIPAEHHHFVHWNNGSLDPTTNVFVIMDTTLTATFAIDQHIVTAKSSNNALGTVAGAGTYNYGEEVTLTATPAAHAVFTGWSNGLTDDTITITLAGDTTVTAMFAADTHTIAATADPTMGSVTGAGEYVHGTLATLTATANEHYHFVNWSNGLTVNTFSILVDKDSTVTANFAIDQHVVTANVNNNALGTVAGAGTYNYGATATLTATPAAHAVFTGWSNGETDATINITVAGDTTVTAMFAADTHTIAATADPTMGNVTGAGEYVHGTLATLTATANEHYHFVNWSNGLTVNSFSILVDKDSTVTANFAIDQHVVTVNANDNALGTVAGAGAYNYGATATLTATPAAHAVFTGWSNGATTATINITVAGDTTVTAMFAADTHTIAATANPTMGNVTGAGEYVHGTLATLTAVANAHYHFVNWSNGLTVNTFSILVDKDSTVVANFAIDQHVVTANANNYALGTVAGAGAYNYGATATLTATPAAHAVFTGWSNGATTATINITVAGDTTVTAMFAADTHTIAATADPTMGSVTGAGEYVHGTLATLTATANEHYHFVNWSNGLTVNTFSILVDNDSTVTANFAIDQHVVTANANNYDYGTVAGAGAYDYGAQVTLTATAAPHYLFTGWSDGTTANPYTFTLTGDVNVTAIFAFADPITNYIYVTYCDNETEGTKFEGYSAGIYDAVNTYIASTGGDSVVDSVVTILPTYDLSDYETIEVGKSLVWHDMTIVETTAGNYTYVDSALTAAGCDSVTTLYLQVTAKTDVEVISDVKMPIIVAPNPIVTGMTTYVNRDWNEEEREGMYVEIIDNFGKVIDHFTPENFPIEVNGDMASGIYHIRVVTGTQDVYVEKLIVK